MRNWREQFRATQQASEEEVLPLWRQRLNERAREEFAANPNIIFPPGVEVEQEQPQEDVRFLDARSSIVQSNDLIMEVAKLRSEFEETGKVTITDGTPVSDAYWLAKGGVAPKTKTKVYEGKAAQAYIDTLKNQAKQIAQSGARYREDSGFLAKGALDAAANPENFYSLPASAAGAALGSFAGPGGSAAGAMAGAGLAAIPMLRKAYYLEYEAGREAGLSHEMAVVRAATQAGNEYIWELIPGISKFRNLAKGMGVLGKTALNVGQEVAQENLTTAAGAGLDKIGTLADDPRIKAAYEKLGPKDFEEFMQSLVDTTGATLFGAGGPAFIGAKIDVAAEKREADMQKLFDELKSMEPSAGKGAETAQKIGDAILGERSARATERAPDIGKTLLKQDNVQTTAPVDFGKPFTQTFGPAAGTQGELFPTATQGDLFGRDVAAEQSEAKRKAAEAVAPRTVETGKGSSQILEVPAQTTDAELRARAEQEKAIKDQRDAEEIAQLRESLKAGNIRRDANEVARVESLVIDKLKQKYPEALSTRRTPEVLAAQEAFANEYDAITGNKTAVQGVLVADRVQQIKDRKDMLEKRTLEPTPDTTPAPKQTELDFAPPQGDLFNQQDGVNLSQGRTLTFRRQNVPTIEPTVGTALKKPEQPKPKKLTQKEAVSNAEFTAPTVESQAPGDFGFQTPQGGKGNVSFNLGPAAKQAQAKKAAPTKGTADLPQSVLDRRAKLGKSNVVMDDTDTETTETPKAAPMFDPEASVEQVVSKVRNYKNAITKQAKTGDALLDLVDRTEAYKTPEGKRLIEKLRNNTTLKNTKVVIVDSKTLLDRYNKQSDSKLDGIRGMYESSTDTIFLADSEGDGVNLRENGIDPEIMLHELAHAATAKEVNSTKRLGPRGKEVQAAVDELNLIRQELKDFLDKDTTLTPTQRFVIQNATKDADELIAYTYTSTIFQNVLRTRTPTLWERLKKSIMTLLKFTPQEATLLDRILNVSDKIIDSQEVRAQKQEKLTEKYRNNAAANYDIAEGTPFNVADYRPSVVNWAKNRWGDSVAPNGRPVWQNFTEWFGNSKAVNPDGTPMVLYHGMTKPMIDPEFRKSNWGTLGDGIYFTPDPTVASSFAFGDRLRNGNINPAAQASVVPMFLKIENPFSDDFFAGNADWQSWLAGQIRASTEYKLGYPGQRTSSKAGLAAQAEKILSKLDSTTATLADVVTFKNEDGSTNDTPWGTVLMDGLRSINKFDGIILKNSVKGFDEYLVLDSNQAKSAIGNTGDFSPNQKNVSAAAAMPPAETQQRKTTVTEDLAFPGLLDMLGLTSRGTITQDERRGETSDMALGIMKALDIYGGKSKKFAEASEHAQGVIQTIYAEERAAHTRMSALINASKYQWKKDDHTPDGIARMKSDPDKNVQQLGAEMESARQRYKRLALTLRDEYLIGKEVLTKSDIALAKKITEQLDTYLTRAYIIDIKSRPTAAPVGDTVAQLYVKDLVTAWNLGKKAKPGDPILKSKYYVVAKEAVDYFKQNVFGFSEGWQVHMSMDNLRTRYRLLAGHGFGNIDPDTLQPRGGNPDPNLTRLEQGRVERTATRAQLVEEIERIMSKVGPRLDETAEQLMLDVLGATPDGKMKAESEALKFYRGQSAIDRTILSPRKPVPEAIQALWGKIVDPFDAMFITMQRLANTLAKTQMMNQELERGRREGFIFAKEDVPPGSQFTYRIEGADYGALNNMYTSKAYKAQLDAFIKMDTLNAHALEGLPWGSRMLGNFFETVSILPRWVKWLDVVVTPDNYVQNTTGSTTNLVMNGNFDSKTWESVKFAMKVANDLINPKNHIKGQISPETLEVYEAFILDSALVGELKSDFNQDIFGDILTDFKRDYSKDTVDRVLNTLGGKTIQTGNAVITIRDRLTDIYAMMDLWSKIANYKADLERLKDFNKEAGQGLSDAELRRIAAFRTRATNLSQQRAINAVRFLENSGITTYMVYYSEMLRTTLTNFMVGINDMKIGYKYNNKKMMAYGARRLIGTSTALGFNIMGTGVSWMLKAGVLSWAAQSAASLFDDDDLEKIQKALGEFGTGRILLPIGVDKDNNPMFMDSGRPDPLEPIGVPVREILTAFYKGEDVGEAADRAWASVTGLAFTNQLWAGLIASTVDFNYNKEGQLQRNAPDSYMKFVQNLQALGFDTEQADRFIKFAEKAGPRWAVSLSASAEADSGLAKFLYGTGHPIVKFDVKDSPRFIKAEYDRAVTTTRQKMFDELSSGRVPSKEDLASIYLDGLKAEYDAFQKAKDYVAGARAAGFRETQIRSYLKEQNFPEDVIPKIMRGTFKSNLLNPDMGDRYEKVEKELANQLRDPAKARQLSRELKQKLNSLRSDFRNWNGEEE